MPCDPTSTQNGGAASPTPEELFAWATTNGLSRDVITAVEKRLATRRRKRRVATCAVATLLFLAWWIPWFTGVKTYHTEAATLMAVTLPDGSHADLGALTTLRTDFRYGRREVTLVTGDVFLNVTHDSKHPFLVHTDAGTIEVKGTTFSVRLARPGGLEVTLVTGSIALKTTKGRDLTLHPNEQVRVGPSGETLRLLTAAETNRATYWREGRISLDGITLGEALEQFARFHARVVKADGTASSIRLGGVFPLNDFDRFLETLSFIAPVQTARLPDGAIHVRTPPREK